MDEEVYKKLKMKHAVENATEPFKRYFRAETEHYKDACRGARCLEVGVGGGRVIAEIHPHASEAVGIDMEEAQLEDARNELRGVGNASLYRMDACNTAFKDGEFDVVLLSWNFLGALVGKADAALKEAKRVLKKDGRIIATFYAENAAEYQIEFYTRIGLETVGVDNNYVYTKNKGGNEVHYHERFSKKKIENLYRRAGLKPEISRLTEFTYLVEAVKE